MTHHIRDWRPQVWEDFVGANNQRQIAQLRLERSKEIQPKPLLISGPIGAAKTSLARHLIASYCCPSAQQYGGNPCGRCAECQSQGPDFNGDGLRFRHYEIDCTSIPSRAHISEWMDACFADENVACFWDEAHRLEDNDKIEMLLKPIERFQGIFILAMTDDRVAKLNPAMLDRVRKVQLVRPTFAELVGFLEAKAPNWSINSSRSALVNLVKGLAGSFRSCLDVMQRAVDINGGVLDSVFLEEQCGIKPVRLGVRYE